MDERGPQPGAPNPYAQNPYAQNPYGQRPPSPFGHAPNPYAAPVSDAGPGFMPGLDDHMLASPWTRLGAAMLDGFLYMLVAVPVALMTMDFDAYDPGAGDPFELWSKIGIPVLLVAAVQWYLIATSGQTVGKKLVGGKIIKTTGEDVNFVSGVVLRSWVPAFIGWVPFVGSIFGLVDALFIFGADHRCIHDMIAGTKVISV